ncbi:hypothetical protein [Sinorhizobium saheli]|uniref:Uncharacterized protein n=1 Tax=Sinorhizobium saheli TaxID=36856 RepID=A0A178XWT5_SINSA|nr:hypothetical protein [Sinorhizobium saheli]MQW89091.1 hypothetical protein [Sinorhizobium saheli]OAP39616.1 hypothetical protein ATB98_04620 [Sinorhizobium saheli]
MTTAMAAVLHYVELKSNDRGAPTTPFVKGEGSTSIIKGMTIPMGLHKRNCQGRVIGARRSDKSAASTATLSQRTETSIRPKAPHRFIDPLGNE